jgi:hypothetical protein
MITQERPNLSQAYRLVFGVDLMPYPGAQKAGECGHPHRMIGRCPCTVASKSGRPCTYAKCQYDLESGSWYCPRCKDSGSATTLVVASGHAQDASEAIAWLEARA